MSKTRLILINILVFILILALVEAGFRLLLPAKKLTPLFSDQNLRIKGRSFIQAHPKCGFALVPGFHNEWYTIDAQGFRNNGIPPQKTSRVILAIGESTTFGWGVTDQQTYPWHLQQYLRGQDPNIRVINAGVPSYTSSQVLCYLEEILNQKKIKPDLILVNILWNDIWYATIKNWHPDILIYQKPPQWLTFLSRHSRLVYALSMGLQTQQLVDIDNPGALAKYLDNTQKMIQLARQNDIPIAFAEPPLDADHIPARGLNEFQIRYTKPFLIQTAKRYQQQLKQQLKQQRVAYIKHRLGLERLHQKALFLDALHPTPQGNDIMAQDIYKKMISSPVLNLALSNEENKPD